MKENYIVGARESYWNNNELLCFGFSILHTFIG